jgi:glycosyltransferase involved in cell wall biosynthesis
MRIGIDLTAIWRPVTGMERVAIESTKALLSADASNRYTLFFSGAVHDEFRSWPWAFTSVLAPRGHELVTKQCRLPALVARARLDYMHFPLFPPPWRLSCPMSWTLPDATPWLYPETMKFSSRWYYRVFGARAARSCRMIITDSQASRRDLLQALQLPSERVQALYPGLSAGFRQFHDEALFAQVRRKYGLPQKFILFVGTLEPRKNLPRLLDAFCRLKARHQFAPDLVIVGRRGWISDPILAGIRESRFFNCIHLTGHVPDGDLAALYNMARLLAFPSRYEGFGLPALEAMACGCPVVTSNRGALFEVTAGAAAYCDPGDTGSIAEAILRAASDEAWRARVIAQGFRRAADFSWRRYAEQFLKLLARQEFAPEPVSCSLY